MYTRYHQYVKWFGVMVAALLLLASAHTVFAQTIEVPVISSLSPQEALPGSEIIVRGTGFKAWTGNYVNIRFGDAATQVIKVQPITVIDASTIRFALPTTYSFFGTYAITVFIDGSGESNPEKLQVLEPEAVGGETVRTGVRGFVDGVMNTFTNAAGNFTNSTPVAVSDPSSVTSSIFLLSLEPKDIHPGATLTLTARGVRANGTTSYNAYLKSTSSNDTFQLTVGVTETSSTVTITVTVPANIPPADYTLQILSSPAYDISNAVTFRAYAAGAVIPPAVAVTAFCIPLAAETQPSGTCPTGQTGSITQTRVSSCPGPTWSGWVTSNTCVASQTGGVQAGQSQQTSPLGAGSSAVQMTITGGVDNANGGQSVVNQNLSQISQNSGVGAVTGIVISGAQGGATVVATDQLGVTGATANAQSGSQNNGAVAGVGAGAGAGAETQNGSGVVANEVGNQPAVGVGVQNGAVGAGSQNGVVAGAVADALAGQNGVIGAIGNGVVAGGVPAGTAAGQTVFTLLARLRGVLDALIPFIIGLAMFVIVWGIFQYVVHAAEEEKRAEAKRFITYGIIGVFFMISIWGFVVILVNTFGVQPIVVPSNLLPTIVSKPIPTQR